MNTQANIPAADRTVTKSDNAPLDPTKLTDAQRQAIAKTRDALVTELSSIVTEEVNNIVVWIDQSKKDADSGPFVILKWFKENVDSDTLAKFPRPGSELGDNPDKYKEPYFREGKLKFKATSFYLKFFLSAFPEGKRIASALAHIALAKDENANQAAVPQNIRDMNPVQLEQLKQDLTSQQNRGVRSIRDAIALNQQLDAINDLPEVAAAPIFDDDGNVVKMSKPIKVWNVKSPEQQWNLYSISGFMQFDPDKAAELGGTYDALKLTAKREQSEIGENAGQSDKPVVINTNATLAARINDIAEYICNKLMPAGNKNREVYGLFLKDQINGPDGGDLIYNLNEIKLFVDGVLNIPSVQVKLEKMSEQKDVA